MSLLSLRCRRNINGPSSVDIFVLFWQKCSNNFSSAKNPKSIVGGGVVFNVSSAKKKQI